jgi:hypothetical protein
MVGGFAIFVSIFVIDLSIGASQGTFYKLVGFSAGIDGVFATLFGMIVHMVTASLIGTIFGFCSGFGKILEISSMKKGALAGTVTGIVVFLVFFVPISVFIMMPLVQSDASLGDSGLLLANMNLVMIGSLELHVVFGITMGTFFSIAIHNKLTKSVLQTVT